METFSPGELRSVDWGRAHAHDRLHRPDQKALRHFQMALVRTGHLQIACKTLPVHVAAAPRVPHDRSVVGKAGAACGTDSTQPESGLVGLAWFSGVGAECVFAGTDS